MLKAYWRPPRSGITSFGGPLDFDWGKCGELSTSSSAMSGWPFAFHFRFGRSP